MGINAGMNVGLWYTISGPPDDYGMGLGYQGGITIRKPMGPMVLVVMAGYMTMNTSYYTEAEGIYVRCGIGTSYFRGNPQGVILYH